ncbi:protein of unknown function [Robiginitalea myxolifaciens]|uniref:Acyl-coenzyme A thioesterase PaaI, contains HGG motif n=1 Tax=Robiginitalea myxolifaciens TaxID=400055 RepID=A0A1I6FMX0_9FLAO|nr:DUF4442 domain-containing protein [Robiginitalea myxolifaciens]SFR31289.1 protein of unknown function [Robiginitalea myxolifaciens]
MAKLERSYNTFMMLKLPSAWICGVRLKSMDGTTSVTSVKHRWMNQNPFKSMFWAVQGMAAEFATGALVIYHIRKSGKRISMLVLNNKANFSKKATGRINFICPDGDKLQQAISRTIETGEGQTVWMQAIGKDQAGDVVSTFDFEWTLKVKQN